MSYAVGWMLPLILLRCPCFSTHTMPPQFGRMLQSVVQTCATWHATGCCCWRECAWVARGLSSVAAVHGASCVLYVWSYVSCAVLHCVPDLVLHGSSMQVHHSGRWEVRALWHAARCRGASLMRPEPPPSASACIKRRDRHRPVHNTGEGAFAVGIGSSMYHACPSCIHRLDTTCIQLLSFIPTRACACVCCLPP